MIGNTIIVVIVVTILGQTVLQGIERGKQHREIMERLERLEAKLGTRN